ncbi:hypothetical protein [Geomonas subterranea]|uniref:hypothetical protein n=1 Tax=Geomonas subterranea TaxID=2847989 RepID=UPI001CD44EB2|nr:hypothetical protein [Geomonas fuzhouensis]
MARAIRPVISPILHQKVIAEVTYHRGRILASESSQEIIDYINRATDAECLCALSEMYLNAPLNDAYYHLFEYLVVKVFTALKIEIPDNIEDADARRLTEMEEHELESLRLGIRKTQKRTIPRGGH